MDRLKFRVWDKQDGCYWTDEQVKINIQWLLYPDNANIEDVILEQSTGLKDKNDKLIYEGDIVKGKATIGEGGFEYLGCIKWNYQSELIGWCIEDKDGRAWELKQAHAKISADNITGEIIGNIHDNADLLGEK